MTVSAGAVLRLGALVLLTIVLQLSLVSQISVWGGNADLIPLMVVAVGLLAGPVPGATIGFAAGVVVDMALVQTLGVTSLLLTGVGYLAGRYRELRDASHALLPALAGIVATVAYMAGFSLIQFLLGVESPVSALVIRDMLVGALLNGLIATAVFATVRSILRPFLLDDTRPRRRSPATGLRVSTGVRRVVER